ncbi:signal transducer CD24-like [Marmota marmota marmota]|uniref:Uncharacterized protein n=1 Tax=Marmota marmota marmota TaxID=9994 RepID=A0A8C6ESX3_MARMA|nr:signal transducer CD24-like [Marmota marmota marmota]
MGRAIVASLELGLLLLTLLLPTKIYSNQTAVMTLSSNSSQSTSPAPSSTNATPNIGGSALQSTASLLVILLSLLHLYNVRDSGRPRNISTSPSSKSNLK